MASIDNASSDGSPEMVESEFPEVVLVRNPINLGFAGACNIGFKHSQGRYYLLLNSDTIVLRDSMAEMARFMDEHPEVGISGCRLLNPDGTLQRSCSTFPGLLTEMIDSLYLSKLFPSSRVFGGYAMTWCEFDRTMEVDFVGGSCMIVRRDAVEEVGLLDESYFMYTEEADWCYRMWDMGWSVMFYPGAEVIHLGGRSARVYGSDMLLHLYVSRNKFVRKHQGRVMAVFHRLAVATGALARLSVFTVRRRADAAAFHRKLLRWSVGLLPNGSLPGPGGGA